MEMKEMPQLLRERIEKVKERIESLTKQYKSLANYGRPYFEDVEEVAVVYYLNTKLGVSLDRLADYLGVDKTGLYKLVRKIEEKGQVSITNPETKRVEVVNVSPQQLVEIVEGMLQVSARQRIQDPLQSAIVKEFWEKDIERMANKERRQFYSVEEKKMTISVIRELMKRAGELGLPTNPDFWDKDALMKILDGYEMKKKRYFIKQLRRIPKFRPWLSGYIGAERKYVTPKMSVIFYKDYLKIKEMYKKGEISEALYITVWLHLTTGAREGWESEIVNYKMDLDEANTSLIGLKWEKLTKVGETWILRIYEHKTLKEWLCDLSWLDSEPIELLLKYRRERGSIMKSITGMKTVSDFMKWYMKELKELSEKLGLGFKLTPHDLRRSHISILAELGVPLELAVSGNMDFGVGWEDLATAVIFYLRFSKHVKEQIMKTIMERKKSYQI